MTPLFRVFVLLLSALLAGPPLLAQTAGAGSIDGVWQGTAAVRGGARVPITLRISGAGASLRVALLNGRAAHPEEARASSAHFVGGELTATYDSIGRGLKATLTDGTLSGTYGPLALGASHGVTTPFTARRVERLADPAAAPNPPDLAGLWEIAVPGSGGSSTWELRIAPAIAGSPVRQAVIQRPDGDTGSLFSVWDGSRYTFSHYTQSGAALYSVTPQRDGTLAVKNLIEPTPLPAHAGAAPKAVSASRPAEYIARRPESASAAAVQAGRETGVKDPKVPFAFSFPDLSGRVVASTDAEFRGKVVIVALGGAWCPNCHDEAPFLVELYRRYHARGLEIVGLDFEEGDPVSDAARLRAFIRHYGIPYPMLLAGATDEAAEKLPQTVNLSSWPTSFFLGRDGLVKEVHSGFAGPANPAGHAALVREVTALVEKLLADPAARTLAGR
ncbi:MAG: TlpA family protein disulfide reductase [Acidobacteriota bacterium]|nr:TlpA family protein disulfide reductase [Acidobacteriota bacterium]